MRRLRSSFRFAATIALGTMVALGSSSAFAKKEDAAQEIKDAKAALEMFKKGDPGLSKHLNEAVGYAVFPSVGKGAFVVGGAGGRGILFEKGVPVGTTNMSQVTVGAQVGGQEFAELIIFKDPTALNDFKRGRFAFQGGVSAVAGGAGASANLEYQRGVATMTMTKGGLMYEAAIGGQKFSFEPFEKPAPRT